MSGITKFIAKNWLLLTILTVGLFLRAYKPLSWFMYSHDQDLAGWMVKDILVNKHLRLVGQETSSQGVFIGPLFYYLQIPFYLLTGMDPAGPLVLGIILGVFAIYSFYFVFSKIFNQKIGLISSIIYAISYFVVSIDRDLVPTMPAMLWSVWYLYSLWLILKGRSRAYILVGILAALIWNFHLALIIILPLVFVAQIISKKRLSLGNVFIGLLIFVIIFSPFLVFETRHSFQQTKAIFSSLTTSKNYVPGTSKGFAKIDRIFQLVRKNTSALFWGSKAPIPVSWTLYFFTIVFVLLVYKKIIPFNIGVIFILWQVIYIMFFSVNSLNPSEYYFNGMNVIWIAILSVAIGYLVGNKKKKYQKLAIAITILFVGINLFSFFTRGTNKSGYLERKEIVNYINEDARKYGYPCVAVSYITDPGYKLGYRYLFWLKGMHVNQPISGSPVYTIVFPHSKVDRIDRSFGALGLIFPDYKRYKKDEVEKSCSGENSNLTDPMFGYTE